MHSWGDGWEHWGDLFKAVDYFEQLCVERGFSAAFVKEKLGELRAGIYWPETKAEKTAYRNMYVLVVAKYPHLYTELLVSADWPELLEGIVKVENCEHKGVWSHGDRKYCAVCGKDV